MAKMTNRQLQEQVKKLEKTNWELCREVDKKDKEIVKLKDKVRKLKEQLNVADAEIMQLW